MSAPVSTARTDTPTRPTWILQLLSIPAVHGGEVRAGLVDVIEQLRVGALAFPRLAQQVVRVVDGGVAVVVTVALVRVGGQVHTAGAPALTTVTTLHNGS